MIEGGKRIVVTLDLGSSELRCAAAEIDCKGAPKLLGYARQQSRGFKRGVIVNIIEAASSIRAVVRDLELSAGISVSDVQVGVSGTHLGGFSSRGVVAIPNNEISPDDVARAVEAAKTVDISLDRRIIHVVRQGMSVDDQDGITDPIGMIGSRLDAQIYSFTSSRFVLDNMERVCVRAGLNVASFMPNHIASSSAVLTNEEKELGMMVLDMGAETTGMVCYRGNLIWFADVLPYGGDDLTREIATGLNVTLERAEKIKKARPNDKLAYFKGEAIHAEGAAKPHGIVEQAIKKLAEIIQVRSDRAGFTGLAGRGIVLTGGAALTPGLAEEIERLFNLPVRIGSSLLKFDLNNNFNSPENAACAGVLLSCTDNTPNTFG